MSETRVDEAILALVALWTAADISTVDGPFVSGDTGDRLFVGYDGDPEGEMQAAELESEWSGIGTTKRDEEFDIFCAVVTRSGFRRASEARTAALALYQTASVALRANPSLGLPPPSVAAPKPQGLFTPPTSQGVQGRLVFNVHVKTRI
jgi:hypothetical protein